MNRPSSSEASTLELYRQACLSSRALLELRFKHFATFMVLTGLIGALLFRADALKDKREFGGCIAVLLSVMFWLLDYRTYQHFLNEELKVAAYERALNDGCKLIFPSSPPTLYRASFITNAIFALIIIGWAGVCFPL